MPVVGRSASGFVPVHISGSFVLGAVIGFVGCGRFLLSLWVATIKVGGSRKARILAGAIKEAFEETGLMVELVGFLVDVLRTTTYSRYYLARRIGGNPADMAWEAQAVMLVPRIAAGGGFPAPRRRHDTGGNFRPCIRPELSVEQGI